MDRRCLNNQSSDDAQDEVRRKMRMLGLFMQDVIEDPSLADFLPDQPEYLDCFERGTPTGRRPDFQTPRVDVYVIPEAELHINHRKALHDEFPWRT